MKAATAIGIVAAVVGILGSAVMEGTSPAAFINIPAIIIVFMGTGGATLAAAGMERMKAVPKLYQRAFSAEPPNLGEKVQLMVGFAERARKDGLLALESEVAQIEDPFTRKGLQLVVDGTDPDMLREILESEIEAMSARHKGGTEAFKQAGGFAPTMGVLGTVMGLVHVLENLDKPETLGPAISGAFIATLFGVGAANVVFLPVANRLKALSEEEAEERYLLLEGILSIQAGDNPRIVAEKLMSYISPAEREAAGERKAAPAGAPAEPAAEPVPAAA
jgi:chemotaxis protein MotA